MNRGVNRGEVFFGEEGRLEFEAQLKAVNEKFEMSLLAYCLMGNHFHLLLKVPDGVLSEAMHRLLSVFARHTNDRIGRDGPLFRGRFHSIPVETDRYLLCASRYIHRNPLDLPGSIALADFRWSSYGIYLGRRVRPSFVDTETVRAMFGGDSADLARFTEDTPSLLAEMAVTAADVRMLVKAAVAQQAVMGNLEDHDCRGVERAVTILLLDQSLPSHIFAAVQEAVGTLTDEAAKMARYRARRRRDRRPAVGRALSMVLDHLPHIALAA